MVAPTPTTYGVTPPDPVSLSFRRLPTCQSVAPIPLLAPSEFSRIHLQHATAHPPDSVLFPFLHGLEGNNEAQCSFFASTPSTAASATAGLVQDPSGRAICPPRYRGLVWVLCDEDVDGDLPQLATAPTRWEDDLECGSDSSDYSADQPDVDRDVEFGDFPNDSCPPPPVPCPMDMDPPAQDNPALGSSHMHPLALRISTSGHASHLSCDRRHSDASSSNSASTCASSSSSLANSDSGSTAATSLPSPPCHSSSHVTFQEQAQSILGIHDSGVAFVQSTPQLLTVPPRRPPVLTSTFLPSQLIQPSDSCHGDDSVDWEFKPVVVPDGISLRNFGIQVPLYPTISDIVIYSPRGTSPAALRLAARFRRAVEKKLAQRLQRWANAQGQSPRSAHDDHPHMTPEGFLKYGVYVLDADAATIERELPWMIMHRDGECDGSTRTGSRERLHLHRCRSANTIDFAQREKEEMKDLTRASEIITLWSDCDDSDRAHASGSTTNTHWDPFAGQVFLGNSSDVPLWAPFKKRRKNIKEPVEKPSPFDSDTNSHSLGRGFDICIECHEYAPLPGIAHLHAAEQHIRALEMEWVERCQQDKDGDWMDADEPFIPPRPPPHPSAMVHLPFPSSQQAMPSILNALFPVIQFIERVITPGWLGVPEDKDRASMNGTLGNGNGHDHGTRAPTPSYRARPLKVLLYSSDGYTESSVPALCLLMAVRGLSLPEAYLELQVAKRRSFFVYQTEVGLLKKVEARLGVANGHGRPRCYTYGSRDIPRVRVGLARHSATEPSPGSGSYLRPLILTSSPSHFPGIRNGTSPAVQSATTMPDGLGVQVAPQTLRRPRASTLPTFIPDHQSWFDDARFDGSFPSRVLPFLYLGNLNHASNAYMLHALGITHVVSVGECALVPPPQTDTDDDAAPACPPQCDPDAQGFGQGSLWIEEREGRIKVLDIKGVCDDGIDTLEHQLHPICSWIEKARLSGGQVLVHCRVGVSRSATVTIAYMMQHLGLSLVETYLVVRSRRLSVLIQPNMRLLYNLLGWEVRLARERAGGDERRLREELRRALSWPYLAREVHALNEKYLS
ncbi:hypothetical protein PISMIDRAFT_27379 [Pisolithus microcarpus 441]|uniref:Uncharacterized protein n=1 Tax=Pisolithus microcarpus 441 TaxID=765257 RepID=A0A0D0A3E3_9AGAM|nr:hypothetical protein BKA83DRAFT_27379 [Pisolithus microcarpus]KIK28927.1 hypothetical protein PISMIDRAFT_27379 [Pisolithus microcarpus 441]